MKEQSTPTVKPRTNYFDGAHRLTREVKNPRYDGRHRYGEESIRGLEAGTVLFSFQPKGKLGLLSYYNAKGDCVARGDFAHWISQAVEDYQPRTWEECLVFRHGSNYPGQLAAIITYLVETEGLNIGQILRASDATLEDE